jgi:YD repeat-containing protein
MHAETGRPSVSFDRDVPNNDRMSPQGRSPPASRSHTSHDYDGAGRHISVTDALGRVTSFDYDRSGNQIRMRDANTNVTQYECDALKTSLIERLRIR